MAPSRLILIAHDWEDIKTLDFIKENHWNLNSGESGIDKLKVLVSWVLRALVIFCAIFSLIIFFLLLSNIRISILSKKEEWQRLIEMGYPIEVFSNTILKVLALVSLGSIGISAFLSWRFHHFVFDVLWDAKIYWPSGINPSDIMVLISYHVLIIILTWLIFKIRPKKSNR